MWLGKGNMEVKRIKIGGTWYDVIYEKGVTRDEDLAKKVNGKINYQAHRIKIEKGLASESKIIVLLHECIHGLMHHADFSPDNIEEIICVLDGAIIQLLRDNPILYDAIMTLGFFDEVK